MSAGGAELVLAIGTGVFNVVLALFLSPLFEGVIRKLKARIHSRVGPPVVQPYFDLLKLLGKEDLQVSNSYLLRLAPILALSSLLLAALLIPIGAVRPPLGSTGDALLLVYVISLAAVATMLTAMVSESPYSMVGMTREMMMMLTVEPILAVSLIVAAVNARSFMLADMVAWHSLHGPSLSMILAAAALFLAMQAQVGKLPFDIAEAEQEIVGGMYVEQSGPKFALFKWALMAKMVLFSAILVEVFLPWPKTLNLPLDVLITLVKMLVVIVLIGIIDSVNPRVKINQALSYFLVVLFVGLAGLAFALVGA